jgi:dUTP pyrophosphatase
MQLKIKIEDPRLLEDRYRPRYETSGSAAIDLRACIDKPIKIEPMGSDLISTGIRVNLPTNTCMMLYPRSGLGATHGIVLANGTGIVDPDYVGIIMVALWNRKYISKSFHIEPMDRVAQAVITPIVRAKIQIVDSVGETKRGIGGFGSTGIK